jgi:tRNA pseudouridine38-40 synthase
MPPGGALHVGRWCITLEYHGAAFVGWQVQPQGPSIQGALLEALVHLAGGAQERFVVTGSGRTDAGVHAYGQTASFWLEVPRTPSAVRDGLNARLPPSVAVVDARPVPDAFDARRWVLHKTYRYTWLDRRARSPWWADRAWHVRAPLAVDEMAEAASYLVGKHDFSAFRAVGCAAAHPIRVMSSATVTRERDRVVFEIVGNGFLRHMVRIIAGSLTDVGQRRATPDSVRRALVEGRRSGAGQTAPPHGLALMEVRYGDGPNPWRSSEADAAVDLDGDE